MKKIFLFLLLLVHAIPTAVIGYEFPRSNNLEGIGELELGKHFVVALLVSLSLLYSGVSVYVFRDKKLSYLMSAILLSCTGLFLVYRCFVMEMYMPALLGAVDIAAGLLAWNVFKNKSEKKIK